MCHFEIVIIYRTRELADPVRARESTDSFSPDTISHTQIIYYFNQPIPRIKKTNKFWGPLKIDL